jgi:pyrroloquinoline quinone biosynthesis protein D
VSEELGLEFRPKLARKAMLRHDDVRDTDMLLLPERVVELNASGIAILRLCNGHRSIADIARALEAEFDHPNLSPEVQAFLHGIAEQGALEL